MRGRLIGVITLPVITAPKLGTVAKQLFANKKPRVLQAQALRIRLLRVSGRKGGD
jgi:hypothetical protein